MAGSEATIARGKKNQEERKDKNDKTTKRQKFP
jgi:hypothetical protein